MPPQVDQQVMKYEPDTCMRLIGFTKTANVPRSDYMSSPNLIVPNGGEELQKVLNFFSYFYLFIYLFIYLFFLNLFVLFFILFLFSFLPFCRRTLLLFKHFMKQIDWQLFDLLHVKNAIWGC